MEERWSFVRARAETIARGLPYAEHVTNLDNVAIASGTVHVHINPADNESLHWAHQLGSSLPAQALAVRSLPGGLPRLIVRTDKPLRCTAWDVANLFFFQPYHTDNLCHMMNEALLPLMLLVLGVDRKDCEVYTYAARGYAARAMELPHFGRILNATCARVGKAEAFWRSPARIGGENALPRCVSRLTWGLGIKPIFNSFRVSEFRMAVSELRGRMIARQLLPGPMPLSTPALTITLRRGNSGWRRLRSYSPLEERFRIDAHCCDFGQPLSAQLELLAAASVVIGLHGAGLTNILFVRDRALLIELKSSYGLNAFEYRKYMQGLSGGYAAVRARDVTSSDGVNGSKTPSSEITRGIALVVHECIAALQTMDASRCARLPHVMQVLGVGAGEDCFFREWLPLGRAPAPGEPLCPTPSWIEPIDVRGQRACYHVHAHAALSPVLSPVPSPPPSGWKGAPDSPGRRLKMEERPYPTPAIAKANHSLHTGRSDSTVVVARAARRLQAASEVEPAQTRPAARARPFDRLFASRNELKGRNDAVSRDRRNGRPLRRQPTAHSATCALPQFDDLEEALHTCKGLPWCAGVSHSLTVQQLREQQTLWTRRRGTSCTAKRYELRVVPLLTYMGHWTGQDSWVALDDTKACDLPSPELAGKGATLGRVYTAALRPDGV